MSDPTEYDCSEGMRLLIARLQTNPEEFEPGGRFYLEASAVRNGTGTQIGGHMPLSSRDYDALRRALEAQGEQRLSEEVVRVIFGGAKTEYELRQLNATGVGMYNVGPGQTIPSTNDFLKNQAMLANQNARATQALGSFGGLANSGLLWGLKSVPDSALLPPTPPPAPQPSWLRKWMK